MSESKSRAEVLEDVIAAGHAALEHLSRVAPALRGNVASGLANLAAATFGFAIQTKETVRGIQHDLNLARSRSRVFWRGLQSLLPSIDAEQELQPLEQLAEQLRRMTGRQLIVGRLGALRQQLEGYRERLQELLAHVERS